MAKAYVYYQVSYPHKDSDYNPHCFSCAVRKIATDFRVEVELKTTDYESTKCRECGDFIKDQIEI